MKEKAWGREKRGIEVAAIGYCHQTKILRHRAKLDWSPPLAVLGRQERGPSVRNAGHTKEKGALETKEKEAALQTTDSDRGIRSSYVKEVMRLLDIPPQRGASKRAGNEKSTKVLIRSLEKRWE